MGHTSRGSPYGLILTAVMVSASLAGCGGGSGPASAPTFPHDGPTLLAAAAGNLEGMSSFRLKMNVNSPKEGSRGSYRLAMNGVWDARQLAGRMDGTLKGTSTTIVSTGGTEYVSLPAAVKQKTGRAWLGSRGTRTFAEFPDVHRVAAILRGADQSEPVTAQGGLWKVHVVVDRERAKQRTPDPTLRAVLDRLPAKTTAELSVDNAGRPVRVVLVLAGDVRKLNGVVELTDFGVRPDVQTPTADQVLYTLPKNGAKK
ncbi:MAG: hypothetical protein JWN52_5290 [Actinomycetia bacterium]|nr:hypothetical protein [Actinomycetes bacterium]